MASGSDHDMSYYGSYRHPTAQPPGDKRTRDGSPTFNREQQDNWSRHAPTYTHARGSGARPKTYPQNRPTRSRIQGGLSNRQVVDRGGSNTHTNQLDCSPKKSAFPQGEQGVRPRSVHITQNNSKVAQIRPAANRCQRQGYQELKWREQEEETNTQKRQRDKLQASAKPKDQTKTSPLSEEELESFLEEEPSEVLSRLLKKKEEWLALLNQDVITDSTLLVALRVLSSLCDLDPVSSYIKDINGVLSMVESSLFLSKHLTRYLVTLPVKQSQELDGDDANEEPSPSASYFSVILQLLDLFLQHKPCSYSEVGGALILLERLAMKGSLVDQVQQLKISYNSVEKAQRSAKQRAQEKPPPNNFRDIPIFPDSSELRQVTKPFLRKNITQGRYEDVEHYLDVQFRLLREDFVAPLREGVTEFLSDSTSRPQDVRIYNNVFIGDRKMGNTDFVYTLRFDMKPFKHVKWESSKRLLYGSFVCLTLDKFKHIVCATVENRSAKALEEGKFDVVFLTEIPSTSGPFIMAESASYFEACRHVLQGLKQLNEYNFPFKKYIVDVKPSIEPPAYLHNDDSVTYDLSSIVGQDAVRDTKHVPILTLESWPSEKELDLDVSQKAALQAALTKEFTVIQGPPGTGKTYIGLQIMKVLLQNKTKWNENLSSEKKSPILVVCYTNHALDQFLEGIISFGETSIARIGGRSNSEVLKYKNLHHLRQHREKKHSDIWKVRIQLRETDEAIRCILLQLELPTKVLLNVNALRDYMMVGEYRALLLTQKKEEGPPRINPSQKLLDWLQVYDIQIDDRSHPSHQYPERRNPAMRHTEYIRVEDEGQRIQQERQMDDWPDERSTRETSHQKMEKQLFSEEAAYGLGCKKRCGKYQEVLPVVQLQKQDIMTNEEASTVERVWFLHILDRWRLYRLWVQRYKEDYSARLLEKRQQYEGLLDEVNNFNILEDVEILRKTNVIGMTTTGAAKHRQLMQRLAPRIVVVEEAAEVLEAHILTALSPDCQHLILIGDHQQLKPNPTVYRLARWYNLDMSLFERMINNGVPYQQLTRQHRMRPEMSILMKKHFYKELEDDDSVLKMDAIKGVVHNMFFINHKKHEDEDDDNRSRSNQYEALVLAALCKYLIHQGYKPSQITVLTTYTGQLFCFRRFMDRATFEGVRVCVVDNYQGEENDIILLSLVRSNEEGSIGFLSTSNRVCVALSRARMGFYCIGNATILKKAPIWQDILATLEAENKVGSSLSLVCQNHPNTISEVVTADNFEEMVPCGGCNEPCEYRLPCGHVCISRCHPYDPDHEEYECEKPCLEFCVRKEHKCPLKCCDKCQLCKVRVSKLMPDCLHVIQVFCREFEKVTCTEPCRTRYDVCEHRCKLLCGQNCEDTCPEKCERKLDCGHDCLEPCGLSCTEYCEERVKRTLLKCGHDVYMECSEPPDEHKCKRKVTKTLTKCNHEAYTFCHLDPDAIDCTSRCEKILSCGHQCPNVCGKPCDQSDLDKIKLPLVDEMRNLKACGKFDLGTIRELDTIRELALSYHTVRRNLKACEKIVEKVKPRCGHLVKLPCKEDLVLFRCPSPCEKLLECGHKCPRKCAELCPTKKFDINDIYEGDESFSERCREKCEEVLSCGHLCPNKCGEPCPEEEHSIRGRYITSIATRCPKMVQKKLPNCEHTVSVPCFKDVSSFSCLDKCEKILPCGHPCPNKCNEPCPGDVTVPKGHSVRGRYNTSIATCCPKIVQKKLPNCEHTVSVPCFKDVSSFSCLDKCEKILPCGHPCPNKCNEPCPGDVTVPKGHSIRGRYNTSKATCCPKIVQKKLPNCEHTVSVPCFKDVSSFSCLDKCEKILPCGHPCPNKCNEPCPGDVTVPKGHSIRGRYNTSIAACCPKIVQKKLPNCEHTVSVPCFQDVSSFSCLYKCEKILPCGHPCPNKCNEPCPGDVAVPKSRWRQGQTKNHHARDVCPLEHCEVMVRKDLPCGHSTQHLPCWRAVSASFICRELCRHELGCGHSCLGNCQTCKGGLQHKPCNKRCNRQLLCGHACNELCGTICSPNCRRCDDGRGRDDTRQSNERPPPCKHNSKHSQLKTKSCLRPCDRTLPCKHPCIGVCGEPCPPFCKVCNIKAVTANLPKGKTHPRAVFMYLPDCKHLCDMQNLDRMVTTVKHLLESTSWYFKIHSLLCPKCQAPIWHCPRYDSILRIVNESVEEARAKCLANARDNFQGQADILRTCTGSTADVSFDVGGWVRCQQGHVFTFKQEEPRCPEC